MCGRCRAAESRTLDTVDFRPEHMDIVTGQGRGAETRLYAHYPEKRCDCATLSGVGKGHVADLCNTACTANREPVRFFQLPRSAEFVAGYTLRIFRRRMQEHSTRDSSELLCESNNKAIAGT